MPTNKERTENIFNFRNIVIDILDECQQTASENGVRSGFVCMCKLFEDREFLRAYQL